MRHLITAGFIVAALITYHYGLEIGSGLLFLVGMVCELISFKRLRNRPTN